MKFLPLLDGVVTAAVVVVVVVVDVVVVVEQLNVSPIVVNKRQDLRSF